MEAVPESFFLPDPDRARPLMHRYLLGLLSAGLGEPADAMRWAAELDRAPSPAGDPSLAKDLALAVRAETHRLAGKRDAALAALLLIREPPRYQLVLPSPFDPRVRERFVRAQLLQEANRLDHARDLYLGIGRRSVYDLPYLAPALLRLASIEERQGNPSAATAGYRRAAEIWDQADPPLQPEVKAARSRAVRLATLPNP